MNNFGEHITPEKAYELQQSPEKKPLQYFRKLAKKKDKLCECCRQEKIWKFGESKMCFSCTTGEASAEDDFELI